MGLLLYNQWSANKNGTTDEMAWAAMGKQEVQDQLNDSDKPDISAIDILSHYQKYYSGKLMVKVTGLYGIGNEAVEAGDVKIDYPDTLVL